MGKHLLWKLHLLPLADWALYHTLLNWFGLYSYKRIHFSNIPADRTVQLYSTHSHRRLCSCQNRMSKWFKSSFCSGLTDLAPTSQDLSQHPHPHHHLPPRGFRHTLLKLYFWPTMPLLCLCVSIMRGTFVKLLMTAYAAQKPHKKKTSFSCHEARGLFPLLYLTVRPRLSI